MAFTIHDADMAPSTAEALLAGATLAFSPTSAVPVDKLAVLFAVWDNTDGTNADDTTFLTVTDSKGHTWIRAGEGQYSAGVALDGVLAGIFYTLVTTQIETTDTITITHSSALGVAKGATLTAFNRDTAKGVQVAAKGYQRVAASTSYNVVISGLSSAPRLWVGHNAIENSSDQLNTRDTAYTVIQQAAANGWGPFLGSPSTAHVGGRGGYLIQTGTGQDYNNSALLSADRATVLVGFEEVALPVAVGQAVETDSAQSVTARKVKTVDRASTTNVAQAIGRVKKLLVGQAFEVDAAQPLASAKVVTVGRAAEVDSAQVVSAAKVVSLGRATETDASLTITVARAYAVGVASEVDSAGAVVASKMFAVGRATESNQAQTVTPQRAYAVGQAVESDSVQAVSVTKVVSVGRATETDGGTTVTVVKALAIGRAQESASAGLITPIRCTRPDSTVTVGIWTTQVLGLDLHTAIDETPASDADFIQGPITLLAETHTCEVGLGNVTDPAVSTGHVVSYRYEKSAANEQVVDLIVRLVQGTTVIATWTHLAIANGWTAASQTLTGPEADAINDYTDLRLRFSQVTAVGLIARQAQVSWAQFCVPIESGVVVQVGRATETDTAGAVTSPSRVEQASEVDSAQPITAKKVVAVGQASEVDSAQPVTAKKVIAVGQASEIDSSQAVTVQKSLGIGQATETDSASEVNALTGVGQATESDTALPITSRKVLVVGPALEADQALAMVAAKVIPILKALETDTARGITFPLIVGRVIETDSAGFIFRQRNYEGVSTSSGRPGKSTQAERVGASTSVSGSGVSTYTGEE